MSPEIRNSISVTPGTGNVLRDLGFPEAESAELKVKADLAVRIYRRIRELGLT
jgi:hypothetical protein